MEHHRAHPSEHSRTSTEVLIVGAGPSGLSAAAELAHLGISCLVVEPRETVSHDRPRAKTTSARTMEIFRRWGIADQVRAAAALSTQWSDRVIFCTTLSGNEITHFDECFGLRADDVAAERGQQIPQPRLEDVLRAHVAKRPEVRLVLGARVTSIHQSGEQPVTAKIRHADGTDETVEAQWVLGCDGAASTTREAAGIALQGTSDDRSNFNIVFRAPGLDTALGRAVQYWVVGAETPGVLGRLDLGGVWWAIAPGIDAETGWSDPSAIVHALVGHAVEHEILSTDPWTARMLVAERYRSGRIFLVGDAAHVNPPWGGHGYNTCVGDAVNIAWKLAAVIRGWGNPSLLDTYESERRPIAEDTIRIATANMATLATDLAGSTGATVAAEIQRTKKAEFHSLGLVLGYGYEDSPIITCRPSTPADQTVDKEAGSAPGYVPSTAPGRLLPHALMADGRPLLDHLGTGFALVGPLAQDTAGVQGLRDTAARLGVDLTLVETPPSLPVNQFLLVRPDQHVADSSRDVCAVDLELAVGHGHQFAEVSS